MCFTTFNLIGDPIKEQTLIEASMRQLVDCYDSFTMLWDMAALIKRAVQLLIVVLF
jgi:hypothetical protein